MGVVYFLIALATNLVLGLPLAPLTSVGAGILQAIPFFGPFLSWAPPVIVALVLQPVRPGPGARPDGRRLVRGDERAAAADHAGRRRDPPDRGPRLGADRLAGRGHPRGDLRDPDRGRRRRRSSSSSSIVRPADRTVAGAGGQTASRPARDGPVHVPREPTPGSATDIDDDDPTPSSPMSDDEAPDATETDRARGRGPTTRRDGHDPRARPDGAPRSRQGTRRAARRRRGPGQPALAPDAPRGRWTSGPAGRGSWSPTTTASSRAGCSRSSRRSTRWATSRSSRPDTNQSAVGHQKTLMRPLRVRERTLGDGSLALLGRRLADRRRQPRVPRLLRLRLRPRRVGHQLRRQPRRRHHLLGHRQRGDGGGHQQLPGVRDLAGVLRAPRLRPRRPGGHDGRPEHPRARPVAGRAGQHQRARPCRLDEFDGVEVTRLGKRVYQDELIQRVDPARDPLLLDRRPAAVRASPSRAPTSTP